MNDCVMWHDKRSDKFNGTIKENAIKWVDLFERIGHDNRWSTDELAKVIDVYLEGAAYNWIVGLEAWETRSKQWEDRAVTEQPQQAGHAL